MGVGGTTTLYDKDQFDYGPNQTQEYPRGCDYENSPTVDMTNFGYRLHQEDQKVKQGPCHLDQYIRTHPYRG